MDESWAIVCFHFSVLPVVMGAIGRDEYTDEGRINCVTGVAGPNQTQYEHQSTVVYNLTFTNPVKAISSSLHFLKIFHSF